MGTTIRLRPTLQKVREALKELKEYPEGAVVTIKHARSCPCPVAKCWEDPRLTKTTVL